MRLEVLKEASQLGVNLYEEHQRFVQSFEPQWRSDENVMLLLSAIALFTPERCNVVHKDVVKYEQVFHIILALNKHIFLFYTYIPSYLPTYLYRILFLLFVYTVNVVYLLPISPKNIYWNEFCLGRIYADINKQYIRLRNICILYTTK